MIKKYFLVAATGAAVMWFVDPRSGAVRRRRAQKVISPVVDASTRLPRQLPPGLKKRLPRSVFGRSTPWSSGYGPDITLDISVDPTTIAEFVDLARANGVHGGMDIDDTRIVCTACGMASDAETMERLWLQRFEGATDPDDMATVSALRCPACSTVGLLITGYGPNTTAEESDVIVRLPAPRDHGIAPFMSHA